MSLTISLCFLLCLGCNATNAPVFPKGSKLKAVGGPYYWSHYNFSPCLSIVTKIVTFVSEMGKCAVRMNVNHNRLNVPGTNVLSLNVSNYFIALSFLFFYQRVHVDCREPRTKDLVSFEVPRGIHDNAKTSNDVSLSLHCHRINSNFDDGNVILRSSIQYHNRPKINRPNNRMFQIRFPLQSEPCNGDIKRLVTMANLIK